MTQTPLSEDELFKAHPQFKEFRPWLELLNKESDRGAVLVSTGFLEQQLKDILEAFLIKNDGARALFEGGFAPFGSFSARIAACYGLGLISEEEHHDLTLLRRIRNDFAHDIHISFSTPSVIDRCKRFHTKAGNYNHPRRGEAAFDSKQNLTIAAATLVLNLLMRTEHISNHRCTFKGSSATAKITPTLAV